MCIINFYLLTYLFTYWWSVKRNFLRMQRQQLFVENIVTIFIYVAPSGVNVTSQN